MTALSDRAGRSASAPERLAEALGRLYPYRPRLRDRRFWAIQVLLVGIAAAHFVVESSRVFDQEATGVHLHSLFLLPISLFFVPVVYAALRFGMGGALATAAWATVLAIPNLVLFHGPAEQFGEVVQLAMVDAVAVLAGGRVDRELREQRRAEEASAALRAAEARQRAGLRAYAAHVLGAQEAERKRIAQELHDETVQQVVAIVRQLDAAEEAALPGGSHAAIGEARRTAERIVADLYDFARALRPPALEDLGLVSAVHRALAELAERGHLDVSIEVVHEERRLQPEIELALFRIAQEALRNVEYHARASHVRVTIAFDISDVRVEVADDGVGFALGPDQDFAGAGSLGLLGMRERAETIGGTLDVRSSPGSGTVVAAVVPSSVAMAAG